MKIGFVLIVDWPDESPAFFLLYGPFWFLPFRSERGSPVFFETNCPFAGLWHQMTKQFSNKAKVNAAFKMAQQLPLLGELLPDDSPGNPCLQRGSFGERPMGSLTFPLLIPKSEAAARCTGVVESAHGWLSRS